MTIVCDWIATTIGIKPPLTRRSANAALGLWQYGCLSAVMFLVDIHMTEFVTA